MTIIAPEAQPAQELVTTALDLYRNGNYEAAVQYFQQAIQQDDRTATCYLAQCHFLGRGVPKNNLEAIKLAEKALGDEVDRVRPENTLVVNTALTLFFQAAEEVVSWVAPKNMGTAHQDYHHDHDPMNGLRRDLKHLVALAHDEDVVTRLLHEQLLAAYYNIGRPLRNMVASFYRSRECAVEASHLATPSPQ